MMRRLHGDSSRTLLVRQLIASILLVCTGPRQLYPTGAILKESSGSCMRAVERCIVRIS